MFLQAASLQEPLVGSVAFLTDLLLQSGSRTSQAMVVTESFHGFVQHVSLFVLP